MQLNTSGSRVSQLSVVILSLGSLKIFILMLRVG